MRDATGHSPTLAEIEWPVRRARVEAVHIEQHRAASTYRLSMAAHDVLRRIAHNPCGDWIQVNVGHHLPEVLIRIDDSRLVPTLP